jgi:hypothetical protein
MTRKAEIIARIAGQGQEHPIFMPDLMLWYPWHKTRGTLPEGWEHYTMAQTAHTLGGAAWIVVRPWRLEMKGIESLKKTPKTNRSSDTRPPTARSRPAGPWDRMEIGGKQNTQ